MLSQVCGSDTGLEAAFHLRQGEQFVERGHVVFLRIDHFDLTVRQRLLLRKGTGPVEVEVGDEVLAIELVQPRGELLRDMPVSEVLADRTAVLALGKGVVVAFCAVGSWSG